MALEVGQRVGDYEVLALLGAGGMGRVYKVRNIISNREEAMKVLLPDYASEPELATRFMTEIRTLAGLEHPNIAQLRTAFQFENQLVMIMEFVEGTYRIGGCDWEVLVISKRPVDRLSWKPCMWDNGVSSIIVHCPQRMHLNANSAEEVLSDILGVGVWTRVKGPDSMQLR